MCLRLCSEVFAEVLLFEVAKVNDLLGHDFVVLDGKEAVLGEFVLQVRLDLLLRAALLRLVMMVSAC